MNRLCPSVKERTVYQRKSTGFKCPEALPERSNYSLMPSVSSPRKRPAPATPTPADFDVKILERIFAPGGALELQMKARGRDFEARPEQLEMAREVSRSARDGAHLLVEAGTGVGKSYAYLVPLLIWALDNKKRVLIATGTKALQGQLVERDLPFLREMFIANFNRDFAFALCLGTSNYICPRRLAKAQVAGLFASEKDVQALAKIQEFAAKTKTGRGVDMKIEPPASLWAQVNRESDLCLGRSCPLYDHSFFFKARREAEKAQILVANHHLLFAHLSTGGNASGVMPPFDAIVIDEGHSIEDVASSYLGAEVSNLGAAKLIELIASRRSGKTLLTTATFPDKGVHERLLQETAQTAREAVGKFFEELQLALNLDPNRSTNVRMTRPNLLHDHLGEPLKNLEDVLLQARQLAELSGDESLVKELEGFANRSAEMRRAAKLVVSQSERGYVYWATCVPRHGDGIGSAVRAPRLSVHGAPIEVAEALREGLFAKFKPVILTSATLTTGASFDFLIDRLGLGTPPMVKDDEGEEKKEDEAKETKKVSAPVPEAARVTPIFRQKQTEKLGAATPEELAAQSQPVEPPRTLTLGSPFDYRKNALVYVASDLPDPANQTFWEEAAIKRCAEVVKRTEGRAFVLCTSFRLVDQVANFLERMLGKKIRILRQGEMARGALLEEFRRDVHSVLVGTTSFWQGVDVPGESLSCVVIMKLPFAVPDEPIVQARVEEIKKRGEDAFTSYQVPQAVMLFRQGFGRLIRTGNDRGIVAVLDPRVKTKRYGQTFLDSLPDCEVTHQIERLSLFVAAM
ncbi:putative ATP-dependent helicase DinG [Abditibacteriota bacterium]|nr:putative ATP-dependent helicase DinG [Abditibacteriota bacterium]